MSHQTFRWTQRRRQQLITCLKLWGISGPTRRFWPGRILPWTVTMKSGRKAVFCLWIQTWSCKSLLLLWRHRFRLAAGRHRQEAVLPERRPAGRPAGPDSVLVALRRGPPGSGGFCSSWCREEPTAGRSDGPFSGRRTLQSVQPRRFFKICTSDRKCTPWFSPDREF